MTINSCVGDVKKSTRCEVLKTSGACELFQTLFSRPNIKEKSGLATRDYLDLKVGPEQNSIKCAV